MISLRYRYGAAGDRRPAAGGPAPDAGRRTEMIRERERHGVPGVGLALLYLALAIAMGWTIVASAIAHRGLLVVAGSLGLLAVGILSVGFFVVAPNQAKVLQFFGAYAGTARMPGLRWANPFYTKRKISLRVRNFETAKLKVNDHRGNPVEIAAVVVWRVVDSAEAAFQVDDYENYVHVQSEAALRTMAMNYPYDPHLEGEISLTSHTAEISERLRGEIQERLAKAGVEVLETRMSHLAYSPEIAAAMLRRQQASAVVAARAKIVEGAVGMV